MDLYSALLGLAVGAALGAFVALFFSRILIAKRDAELAKLETTLIHERQVAEEKIRHVQKTSEELRETFRALSAEALRQNNLSFLDLAKSELAHHHARASSEMEQRKASVDPELRQLHDRVGDRVLMCVRHLPLIPWELIFALRIPVC